MEILLLLLFPLYMVFGYLWIKGRVDNAPIMPQDYDREDIYTNPEGK